MSDPVAEKSTFLCMYMSNHPDTLVAYVKYWGKVKEQVVSAKMSSIDSNVSVNARLYCRSGTNYMSPWMSGNDTRVQGQG